MTQILQTHRISRLWTARHTLRPRPLRNAAITLFLALAAGQTFVAPASAQVKMPYARTASSDGLTLDTANSLNPGGTDINVFRNGVGDYNLQWRRTPSTWLPFASALGPDAEYCKINDHGGSGTSIDTRVRCYDAAGNAADTRYTVTALVPNNEQQIAFAWIASDTVQPAASWNPSGGISANRTATGQYSVTFNGLNSTAWPLINAHGANNLFCWLSAFATPGGNTYGVSCRNTSGVLTDSDFVIAIPRTGASNVGFAARASVCGQAVCGPAGGFTYNSSGGAVTYGGNAVPGTHVIRFVGLNPSPLAGGKGPSGMVAPQNDASARCSIDSLVAEGSDVVATVFCFGPTGLPRTSDFGILVTPPEQGDGTAFTYYLNQVLFSDGGRANGSFQFNPTTNAFSNINVTTTPGSNLNGFTYNMVLPASPGNASFVSLLQGAPAANYIGRFAFGAELTSPMTGAAGFIPVKTQSAGAFFSLEAICPDANCLQVGTPNRTITAGWVSTTNCIYSFVFTPPGPVSVPAGGGAASVLLNTQAGCPWTASSTLPWAPLAAGNSTGTGQSQVLFDFQANNTGAPRNGTVTIAGSTVSFTQAAVAGPTCSFSLSQTSATLPAAGTSSSITVTNTAGQNCNWTVSNPANWIIITGGGSGGIGSGTVFFTAQANPSTTSRSATLTIAGISVNITQTGTGGAATSGLKFVPITPCRLVDTRFAYAGPRTGAFGPPLLNGASTRTIPIPSSSTCFVPASAKAYVFNVTLDTIENSTGPVDFVTVYPTGEARPDFWTARTTTGGYIANAAIVKAGINGSVDVYTSNSVNFILDINGYFTDDPNTPGLLYYPIQPCRAVDTRGPIYSTLPAPYGNQRMNARETRTLRLPGSRGCQLPVAPAYSTQLTLAPGELTNGNPVAFLTAWPSGVAQPNISNMNAFFGFAVANSGIIPASGNGSIDVFAFDSTNVIIDVNGYFAPDDGTGRGLLYFPVTQCRVMNTTDGTLGGSFGGPALSAGADRTLPVPSGRCSGLPSTAKAWAANATVIPNGVGMAYLSMWPAGTPWPNISQLNAFQGQTVSNSGIVPAAADGSIAIRVATTTHAAVDIAGYFSR